MVAWLVAYSGLENRELRCKNVHNLTMLLTNYVSMVDLMVYVS